MPRVVKIAMAEQNTSTATTPRSTSLRARRRGVNRRRTKTRPRTATAAMAAILANSAVLCSWAIRAAASTSKGCGVPATPKPVAIAFTRSSTTLIWLAGSARTSSGRPASTRERITPPSKTPNSSKIASAGTPHQSATSVPYCVGSECSLVPAWAAATERLLETPY